MNKKINKIFVILMCISLSGCGLTSDKADSSNVVINMLNAYKEQNWENMESTLHTESTSEIKEFIEGYRLLSDDELKEYKIKNEDICSETEFQRNIRKPLLELMTDIDYEILEVKESDTASTVKIKIKANNLSNIINHAALSSDYDELDIKTKEGAILAGIGNQVTCSVSIRQINQIATSSEIDEWLEYESVQKNIDELSDAAKKQTKVLTKYYSDAIKDVKKDYSKEVTLKLIKKEGEWKITGVNNDKLIDAISGGYLKEDKDIFYFKDMLDIYSQKGQSAVNKANEKIDKAFESQEKYEL